jgi:hypothetical protein
MAVNLERVRREAQRLQLVKRIAHCDALEIVAKAYGFESHAALKAASSVTDAATSPSPQGRHVPTQTLRK